MRCLACNVILIDEEAKRKSAVTKDYLDLCNACLGTIAEDIPESLSEDDGIWDAIDEEELHGLDLPEA